MLDEPLGSLDRALRERLLEDLRAILNTTGQTTIYVTHDQEEAFALADRVVVMNAGEVVQVGTPQDIYCQPASPFVARFVGLNNILPGKVISTDSDTSIQTQIGEFPYPTDLKGDVQVLIRPEAAQLGKGSVQLSGILKEVVFRGGLIRAVVEINGVSLTFQFSAGEDLPDVGNQITIGIEPEEAILVYE